jgi:hypothetical protein
MSGDGERIVKKRRVGDSEFAFERAKTIPLSDSESDPEFTVERGNRQPGNVPVMLA